MICETPRLAWCRVRIVRPSSPKLVQAPLNATRTCKQVEMGGWGWVGGGGGLGGGGGGVGGGGGGGGGVRGQGWVGVWRLRVVDVRVRGDAPAHPRTHCRASSNIGAPGARDASSVVAATRSGLDAEGS